MGTTQTIFSIAGIVLTLVGLTATYIYFRKNRKYKELSYEILPTLSLISVGAEVRDRVEIKYKSEDGELDDVAIEDLKAVAVTIHNTGTEAVNCKSKDFEDENPQMPVTLDFGQHAQILGEPSTETKPIGRTVHVKRVPGDPGKVLLDTFLLNTRETVTISTFLTDFPEEGKVSVDWHIEGVRQPREIKRERSGLWRSGLWSDITFLLFGVGLTALAAAMTVGIFATGDMGVFVLVPIGITMVFLFGVLAVFWTWFREANTKLPRLPKVNPSSTSSTLGSPRVRSTKTSWEDGTFGLTRDPEGLSSWVVPWDGPHNDAGGAACQPTDRSRRRIP